jgi:hypothetical protein
MFVLCLLYKDSSMEHKATRRRTKGFKSTKWMKGKRKKKSCHRQNNFFFQQNVQTGSESHPAFYSTGTGVFFPLEIKRQGCEFDHSPPSSIEVKNEWSYTFTPRLCLHGLYRDGITFPNLCCVWNCLACGSLTVWLRTYCLNLGLAFCRTETTASQRKGLRKFVHNSAVVCSSVIFVSLLFFLKRKILSSKEH